VYQLTPSQGAQEGQPTDVDKERPLLMRVTDVNRHSHTDNIVRHPSYNVRAVLLTPSLINSETPERGYRKRGL
jgi:hypothetical protein